MMGKFFINDVEVEDYVGAIGQMKHDFLAEWAANIMKMAFESADMSDPKESDAIQLVLTSMAALGFGNATDFYKAMPVEYAIFQILNLVTPLLKAGRDFHLNVE